VKKICFPGLATLLVIVAAPALAQDLTADAFTDGPNGAKVHVASGFVCPATIGHFERDAVGQSDVDTGADFCSYAALDGVYGTIRLTPLSGAYDPKVSLVQDFVEQEGTGGKRISENTVKVAGAPLAVFTRTYETAKLEDLHYHVLFAGSAVQNWAVEAIIEYASPREDAQAQDFLNAVYSGAQGQIAAK
jgi:hypothetical protein